MDSSAGFIAAQEKLFQRLGLKAESRFIEVPSISGRVHVLVSGEGPAVILVPGFGDPAALWAPLMAKLGGFTLYALDRPAFGLTGPSHQPVTTATIRSSAVEFLEQVLNALGLERPLVIGNSIGSLWSTWFALDRPDRVRAMAHVGCPALFPGTFAPVPMRLLSAPFLGRLLMALTPPSRKQVRQFAKMAGEDLSEFPEMVDLLVELQKLPGVPAALRALLRAIIRPTGPRAEVALTGEQLARISQPVQISWGERDPFGTLEAGKQATAKIPNAEFHVISGGGHVPWITRADQVAEVVRPFLRAHSGA